MISVNEIVTNALTRVGIVMDEDEVNGQYFTAGLQDLKSLVAELNTENYLLENYKTYDAFAAHKIKFAVKPDRWFEANTVEEIDLKIADGKTEVGDIFKIKDKKEFYVIRYNQNLGQNQRDTNPEWNEYMSKYWPTFFVKAVPDRAIGVARKIGVAFRQLVPADKMVLDSVAKGHLAQMYASETEFVEVEFPHDSEDPNYKPYLVEYFVIEFDSVQSSYFRITILEGIVVKENGILPYSQKYEAMIEDGLCVKLCQRYKYLEIKPDFEKDFEAAKIRISIINDSNRPMTYDIGGQGYNENYWNLFGGVQWQ